MTDPKPGTDRAGRRSKRFLTPSQKKPVFVDLPTIESSTFPNPIRGQSMLAHRTGISDANSETGQRWEAAA